jgi:hypothetical protein
MTAPLKRQILSWTRRDGELTVDRHAGRSLGMQESCGLG